MPIPPSRRFAAYDRKLVSILEVLSSHYVDIYYNHIWTSAEVGVKKGGALSDEYVRQVKAYITGVKTDPASYKSVVAHLHTYYRTITRYATLSYADFVDQVVAQFVPAEYFALCKAPQKDETFETVVVDLIAGLGAYVTGPALLRRVVDEHHRQPEVTIRMVQDQGVTLLLTKRAEVHNKFLRKLGQAKDHVSMDVVEDLKTAVKRLAKDKAKLRQALGETEERAIDLEDAVAAAKKREAKYRRLVRLLNDERTVGATAAAHRAAAPRETVLAEGRAGDPLDFPWGQRGGRPPPPNLHGERAPGASTRPGPARRPPAEEGGGGINDFFADFDPLAVPLEAPPAARGRPAPRRRKKPERGDGHLPAGAELSGGETPSGRSVSESGDGDSR